MSVALFDYTPETFGDAAHITGTDYAHLPVCIQFVTTEIISVDYYMVDIKSITLGGDVSASLYTDSAGSLGTQITGSEKVLNIATTGIKTFTLDTPKELSVGTSWLVITGLSNPALLEMYTSYINYGQSHRVYANGDYSNGSAVEAGLYYSAAGGQQPGGGAADDRFRFRPSARLG